MNEKQAKYSADTNESSGGGALVIVCVAVIILIIAAAAVLTQVIFPLSFSGNTVSYRYLAQEDWESFTYDYNVCKGDSYGGYQSYIDGRELPSDNYKDYIRFDYEITISNHSVMDIFSGELMIDKIPEAYSDKILFSVISSTAASAEKLSSGTASIAIFIYAYGLTENDISEIANGFDFAFAYDRELIGGGTQKFSIE